MVTRSKPELIKQSEHQIGLDAHVAVEENEYLMNILFEYYKDKDSWGWLKQSEHQIGLGAHIFKLEIQSNVISATHQYW